ncbi:MAG TPA: MarR family transcriptional regulator [Saprospiraceae bacterium]|nr:MarR family transcriptional regulator [Saprospiraceae bacterium]HPG08599.1 MarR family transcriptional regulator [Saprospiraceae bacterium]HQU55002.1 MarR family transcriptional regulator [Saprospiraceae bacterium]HRV85076.1 MarR family transcriptional regulator [Saprospiraceae bacterium]
MPVANPSQTVFYAIEKAIKVYRQFAQRRITSRGIDITVDQLLILRAIQDHEEITQKQIADMVFKDYASITRIIDLLVKKEYLQRKMHPVDRRRFDLTITTDGNQVLAQLDETVASYRKDALRGISKSEVDSLQKLLQKITDNCQF